MCLQGKKVGDKWYDLGRMEPQPLLQGRLLSGSHSDLTGAHSSRHEDGNIWFSADVQQGAAFNGGSHILLEGELH